MRLLVLALAAAGCATQVSQDRATGPDGRIEGATQLTWSAEGRARASGVVTYPGGDRVDWWFVRLPDTETDVEVELSWRSPRPGLRLAFDVFGDDHGKLAAARRGVGKPIARASLSKMRGAIFIRVYARERGDAGAYTLALAQTPSPGARITYDYKLLDIPDPPELPEVPIKVETCSDPAAFDPRGVPCRPLCPPHGPPGTPGCPRCPTPPDINLPDCWATMPCPDPPDPRVRACDPRR